jgi:hypothetical protein
VAELRIFSISTDVSEPLVVSTCTRGGVAWLISEYVYASFSAGEYPIFVYGGEVSSGEENKDGIELRLGRGGGTVDGDWFTLVRDSRKGKTGGGGRRLRLSQKM